MADDRAFVYVVCGAADHVRTLHRSLEYLASRTRYPIVVVTDSRRNEMPIDHETILDVETPRHLDDHQASIFLKTSLHRVLPTERDYVYLDSDMIAATPSVDSIFDHQYCAITFARDLTRLEQQVGTFSPWAVHCGCPADDGLPCSHLADAILAKFGVRVANDWMHWNGGVFLFGREAAPFMELWHRQTLEVFEDPHWKTRDQGTLIATVWRLGLQDQRCLAHQYNFIVDDNNHDLRFDRAAGYSMHHSMPGIHPTFLHLYHAALGQPGWSLARDVEDVLEARTGAQVRRMQTLSVIAQRLARRPIPGQATHPTRVRGLGEAIGRASLPVPSSRALGGRAALGYQVIVGMPRWTVSGGGVLVAALVRGLRARGITAHVVLTEPYTGEFDVHDPLPPCGDDVPMVVLPIPRKASWGSRWGTLVRYLEERSPCIYMPIADWRHSIVSPRLSSRVAIVGIALDDDRRYFDELERLGRYWNAIVSPSVAVADLMAALQPELADRIACIPFDEMASGMADAYARLFERIVRDAAAGTFQRPSGLMRKPPYQAAGREVFPNHYARSVDGVGVFPSYRDDYEDYRRAIGVRRGFALPEWRASLVKEYPVTLGAPARRSQTADRFVASLAQGLGRLHQFGDVLVESGAGWSARTPPFGEGVRVLRIPIGRGPWPTPGQAIVRHLERQSPCLYLPGDEWAHWHICPRLSHQIGVIGRADSLDRQDLQRAAMAARFWNAVVAGSPPIADALIEIDATLLRRIVTIPLPVDVPDRLVEKPSVRDGPLKVVCHDGGGVVHQPSAALGRIMNALADAHVPAEVTSVAGDDLPVFERHDVLLIPSAFENARIWVLEAMGRGCVPVVARGNRAVADLLKDGENGYLVSDGDIPAFAARLGGLQQDEALRRALATRAFETVDRGAYRADDMVTSYLLLFERVLRDIEFGNYRRPAAEVPRDDAESLVLRAT